MSGRMRGGLSIDFTGLAADICNDSGLYSFTGLIFIYSRCGAPSDSEVAPGFYC